MGWTTKYTCIHCCWCHYAFLCIWYPEHISPCLQARESCGISHKTMEQFLLVDARNQFRGNHSKQFFASSILAVWPSGNLTQLWKVVHLQPFTIIHLFYEKVSFMRFSMVTLHDVALLGIILTVDFPKACYGLSLLRWGDQKHLLM